MAKNKDKKKIPFNVFRKGITAGALGLAMLFGGAGMLTGCMGEKGDRGETGSTGKSAYELAVEQGFQGTLTEWLESLKGQSGGAGSAGNDGVGIASITKTGTDGLVDTYTITFTNGSTTTFTITNGQNGTTPNAPEVTINAEGYWVINGVPQSVKAEGTDGAAGKTPYIEGGYWYIDGVPTGVKAQGDDGNEGKSAFDIYKEQNPSFTGDETDWLETLKGQDGTDGSKWITGTDVPTTEGVVGDFYLNTENYDIYEKLENGWKKIGNIKGASQEQIEDSKQIGDHYMISDGLTEMAANAVELVVDDRTCIAYACYLSSETALGEATQLVKIAKFNIMQPTNVEWIEVFNRATDFGGQALLECNIINLNSSTVRVFAVNKATWKYYYKDVNKSTNTVGELKEVQFKTNDNSDAVEFSRTTVNQYISSIGGTAFSELQTTTKILEVDGTYYTTAVGGGGTNNVLFLKSTDGATWTVQSVINHTTNYEAMLEYHDGKFWVFCRNGVTTPTTATKQNLLYSEDGITWTKSNLALTVSDTRPYLFKYQGDLYLAYSSPLPTDFSTVRNWRCNIHVGRVVSNGGVETFEEVVYKESKYGIVYYALTDWYGNMVMLYSSGEMHPTEGLMGNWSQGKDCLNYTIIHQEEPELAFKTLESISIASLPSVTTFNVGDTFDATGLTIRAKYNNGTYQTLSSGFTLSSPDMTTTGTKEVTITYNGKTASFDITVTEVEKVLQSLTIVSQPVKRTYVLNETFSTDGLVVQANYNVGSPKTLSSTEYSITTPDMSTVGTKEITITYLDNGTTKTVKFSIEVVEEITDYIALPSIVADGKQYIDITGYKTKANTKVVIEMEKPVDADINSAGRWLFSSASNGEAYSKIFGLCVKPSGEYVLDYASNRLNTGTINWQDGVNTVTFGNGEFKINGGALLTGADTSTLTTAPGTSVSDLRLFSSPITSATDYLPVTIYSILIYEGDILVRNIVPAQNPDSMKIGLYDTITEAWYYSGTGTDVVAGEEVVENVLSSLTVVSNPTVTQYAVGDTFDPSGLVIKATYVDETYRNIVDYTLSTPDMTTAGTKTITVTYEEGGVEKTTTFEITVVAEKTLSSIEIVSNPTRVSYVQGQAFSADGLVVQANYSVGAAKTLASGEYTLSTPDMTTTGTKTITVTYEEGGVEKTATFDITVNEKDFNELQSIVTDGTQYVNLGYKVKANTKIVITFDKPDDDKMGNGWLFCDATYKKFGLAIKADGAYVLDVGGTRYETGTINWSEGKNTIEIGNGVFTINGDVLVTGLNVTASQTTSTSDLWLLSSSSTTNKTYMQTSIYEVKIYEGDALVMHLVPAERKSDSKVGLYDLVNYKYYFSTPTGTDFTAGPAKTE